MRDDEDKPVSTANPLNLSFFTDVSKLSDEERKEVELGNIISDASEDAKDVHRNLYKNDKKYHDWYDSFDVD